MELEVTAVYFTDEDQPRLKGRIMINDEIDGRYSAAEINVILPPGDVNRQTSYEKLERAALERMRFFLSRILDFDKKQK